MFKDGLKKFSYDALSFGPDDIHYLETELRDDLEFKNLSLSMYVYPTGIYFYSAGFKLSFYVQVVPFIFLK
jgi:hypothetical protein